MGAPLFEKCSDMKELVVELIEKRNDIFGKIDPNMIECLVRIDKPAPPNTKKALEIKGVRGPYAGITPVRYIIYAYSSMWQSLSPEKRAAYLANMLIRIKLPTEDELMKLMEKGKEFEYGKLKTPDIKDFKDFIRIYGVDWDDDEATVPNILEKEEVPYGEVL